MAEENETKSISSYPSPMQMYGSSIMHMTDPEPLISNTKLTLRGKALDEKGNIIPVGERLLNEQGINSVVGVMRSLLNQVTIMSNFNDVMISRLMEGFYDTLIKDLMRNRVTYEIRFESRRKIVLIACNTVYSALSRAKQEGDRRFWKGSQQEITYRTQDGSEKKSAWNSVFGKLM